MKPFPALALAEQQAIALSPKRQPQRPECPWPAGTRIVSADSHLIEGDYWFEGFPEDLKDQAPRMGFHDGHFDFRLGDKPMTKPHIAQGLCEAMECTPGLSDIAARLKDLDAEGVEKELIYPQRLFGLFMFGEMANREHVFGLYNEALAERCAEAPDRLYPVMVPNYWDMSAAEASVARCAELGARALMLPLSPGRNAAGDKIHYNASEMDALYGAAEAAGLPLAFHIGEAIPSAAPGAAGISLITQMQGFRAQWGALTFGGAFDRFPRLKAVFVEAGLSWIPSMLHDADLAATHFANAMRPALKHPPSWYWRAHCYATFMTDPTGLRLLEDIGPETAMWSSDYPHQESTWGYTQSALQAVFDATDVETAQKIVGKTALKLFRMDEPL